LKETTSSQDKSPSAGFGIRALARLIDFFFSMFVGAAAGFVAGMLLYILGTAGIIAPGWQYRIHGFSIVTIGFSFLGNIAYHFFCEGVHGATLGKFCCGLCVMNEDLKPSTFKGAMIRTLAYYVDGLFCGIVGYISMSESPLNQRYGDRWGKTIVVRTKEVAPGARRKPEIFFLGLVAGAGSLFLLLAIGLVLKVL
jgi:uncharacterized RDD family membrane protein YckC